MQKAKLNEQQLRTRLRSGDVLLSRAGTIGKTSVVGSDRLGSIPGPNLYVLRTDTASVDPHYLNAFLSSSAAKAWMIEQTQGAVIRTLSKTNLRRLPVPVPPIQIQSQIADSFRQHGTDAFEYLGRALSTDADNPVSVVLNNWMESVESHLVQASVPENWRKALADLEHWTAKLPPVRQCRKCSRLFVREDLAALAAFDFSCPELPIAHAEDDCPDCSDVDDEEGDYIASAGPIAQWSAGLNETLLKLRGVTEVPADTQLYLIQEAAVGLNHALSRLTGHMPDEERARSITRALTRRISAARQGMLDDIAVSFRVGITAFSPSGEFETNVAMQNRGALPMRSVQVRSEPEFGSKSVGFLPPGKPAALVVRGALAEGQSQIALALHWVASDLAGNDRSGMEEILIHAPTGVVDAEDNDALGASPYVCANPVDPSRDDVFFGREQELDQIRRQVTKSANVVLLEGNRRAGKSSILKHLEGLTPIPGWLGFYSSLQGAQGSDEGTGVPTADVFRTLAADFAKGVHRIGLETPLPDGRVLSPEKPALGIARACRAGISTEGPFNDFDEYLSLLLEVLAESDRGALLLLDEFDKLQEGIDNGVTSPQVPENIRYLVQNHARFSAVLTGSRRITRLRKEYWSALLGLGTHFAVSALPEDAAKRLVTEPVAGRLNYSEEAVKRAIHLTSSHPFLLQNLCNRVFDCSARERRRSVTLDTVDRAAQELIDDNEHFAALWGYCKSDRRRLILALAYLYGLEDEKLRLGQLSDALAERGIEVSDEALQQDLEHLRELELLELTGEGEYGRYGLAIPLMGLWIGKQQDIDGLIRRARVETEDEHE